jgi:type IV secretory pathway VirB2 component (pilin)
MKVPDRIAAISAAAIVALAISLPLAMTSPAAAASRAGPSPFCLMPGSSNGPGGAPEICGYFDYRQCL